MSFSVSDVMTHESSGENYEQDNLLDQNYLFSNYSIFKINFRGFYVIKININAI